MAAYSRNRINPLSLSVQIKDAELQVLNRKRKISVDTTKLVKKAQQQMTGTTSLLLASGVGFIIGEITKHQAPKLRDPADKSGFVETSPLKTALSLVTSIQTLYATLPIVWIMKTFYQPITPDWMANNKYITPYLWL